MNNSHIKDFTQGNITRQLLVFAWPLILSNLLQVVYNMVDMIVVGQAMGDAGLSAVAVGGDLVFFLTCISIGFSNAGQVIIARYIGARQVEKIGRFVGTMSGFLAVSSILISVVALCFQEQCLTLMNTPPEAYAGAVSYSTICMVGLIFICGYNAVSAILRGMGDSKHPLIFIAVSAVLNLILDVLFVFGFHMGAGGAALATVISQAVSFLSCTVFLFHRRKQFQLNMHLADFFRWDKRMLVELTKLGIPMAIKIACVQFSRIFVNAWVNSYGVSISAFAGVASKITNIGQLIANAINTSGSTMVGQNLAAGAFDRVKKILLRLTCITLIVAVILSAVLILFPEPIFGAFTNEADKASVMAIVPGYLPIAALFFFGSALRAVMNALINGSGNTRINFLTAILDGIVLRIGLGLLFGLVFDMRHYGFWLGDALAGYTPVFLGGYFYLSGKWKKAVVRT